MRKKIKHLRYKKRKLTRKKENTQKGKDFGSRFKLLYSTGKEWRNSMQ